MNDYTLNVRLPEGFFDAYGIDILATIHSLIQLEISNSINNELKNYDALIINENFIDKINIIENSYVEVIYSMKFIYKPELRKIKITKLCLKT